MNRRKTGQLAAGLAAFAAFAWAGWTAQASAMPEFKVYDGYWMILGALIAFAVVAPLVWRLRREISMVVITLAALVGCVAPLAISALRQGIPISVRLRGAWYLGGADFVGPAVVIGSLFLWFAIRKYETTPTPVGSQRR
ncbi:MAG TPA: hypothetical protein VFZ87_10335 [Gemmatimonadales bacterium]